MIPGLKWVINQWWWWFMNQIPWGFGLNWSGVINDVRLEKYRK
jgi:hypothetical protein